MQYGLEAVAPEK